MRRSRQLENACDEGAILGILSDGRDANISKRILGILYCYKRRKNS